VGNKDPVENYRKYLKENKILTEEFDEALRSEIKLEINEIWLWPMPNQKSKQY
jgi:TPP-dependent pyruvate/acetoin dehydrogenase alpha subunit